MFVFVPENTLVLFTSLIFTKQSLDHDPLSPPMVTRVKVHQQLVVQFDGRGNILSGRKRRKENRKGIGAKSSREGLAVEFAGGRLGFTLGNL